MNWVERWVVKVSKHKPANQLTY